MWKVLVVGSNFKTKVVHHYFELRHDIHGVSSSMSDVQQSILDEKDNYSTNNTAVLSTLEVICPPQQQKSTIQTLTDNFDSDTS